MALMFEPRLFILNWLTGGGNSGQKVENLDVAVFPTKTKNSFSFWYDPAESMTRKKKQFRYLYHFRATKYPGKTKVFTMVDLPRDVNRLSSLYLGKEKSDVITYSNISKTFQQIKSK